MKVAGKVAVITGGSSGIGLGTARRLAAAGAKVVVIGRDRAALDRAAQATGGMAVQADVTDPSALADAAQRTLDRHGRIDIVMNNAGAAPTARLAAMTRADWDWLIDVNLRSVTNGIERFLPILRANADGGHIVNTASIAGLFTAPTVGAYSATKYAVVAVSEALSMELAKDGIPVGVTAFLPGPVRSNIHLGMRNRPAHDGGSALLDAPLEEAEGFEGVTIPWIDADEAGDVVVEAIRSNRLYAWTHPEGTQPILERFRAIEASIVKAPPRRQS